MEHITKVVFLFFLSSIIVPNDAFTTADNRLQKRDLTDPLTNTGDKLKDVVTDPSLPSIPKPSLPFMPSLSLPSLSSISQYVSSVPVLSTLMNADGLWKIFRIMKIIVKIASYFVPALGQVKQMMLAIDIARLVIKTSTMFVEGESFSSIGSAFASGVGKAILGRRSVATEGMGYQNDFSEDMKAEDLLNMMQIVKLPKLPDENEILLKKEISSVINSLQLGFNNENVEQIFSNAMFNTVKFLAANLAVANTFVN